MADPGSLTTPSQLTVRVVHSRLIYRAQLPIDCFVTTTIRTDYFDESPLQLLQIFFLLMAIR